jgi:hypothetical protein
MSKSIFSESGYYPRRKPTTVEVSKSGNYHKRMIDNFVGVGYRIAGETLTHTIMRKG